MSPSAAFLAAAAAATRQPVAFLAIENVNANKQVVTTKAEWDAFKSKSYDLWTEIVVGSVELGTLDGPWIKRTQSGSPTDSGGMPVVYNGKIYSFGGSAASGNKVYEYDTATFTWRQVTTSGTTPPARRLHAAWLYNGKMYIHGGRNGSTHYSDLWELNLTTFAWTQRTSSPDSLEGHQAAVIGSRTYLVFNGAVYDIDMATFAWTLPSEIVSPRWPYGTGTLVVYGGTLWWVGQTTNLIGQYNYAQVMTYSLSTREWSAVSASGYGPASDTPMPGFGVYGSKVFVGYMSYFFEYNLATTVWTHRPDAIADPSRMKGVGAVVGNILYQFAGHSGTYDELWLKYLDGATSGTLRTKTIDMGSIPTADCIIEFDDIVPYGCSLTYTVRGSNDNTNWTTIGTVTDGQSIPPYRYYDVLGTFTADGTQTPEWQEVRIVTNPYILISSHQDEPIPGVQPYIPMDGIGSLSSKIDLTKIGTTGELSATLTWGKFTGDMVATGYLRGKAIACKLGFHGLPEADYEPYFSGVWQDYNADRVKMIFNVKTWDVWKLFKRPIPRPTFDGTGKKNTTPLVFAGVNIIQAMLTIIDYFGVPDRFIDRAAATALIAGARSGSNWNVNRTIYEPTPAEDLLNELQVSAGVFLVPLANGKMTFKVYDPAATPVATFDANLHSFQTLDGGQKELSTRQLIYYADVWSSTTTYPVGEQIAYKSKLYKSLQNSNLNKQPDTQTTWWSYVRDLGGNESDYPKGYEYINQTAEVAWGLNTVSDFGTTNEKPSYERTWCDKWGLSLYAIQQIALRWDAWFASPKMREKVTKVPPRFMGVERGELVAVDNLRVPVTNAAWSAAKTYALDEQVVYGGKAYISLQASNLNKQPDTQGAWWKYQQVLASGLTDQKKFLVMGKGIDPKDLTLSFDLQEI